VEGVVDVKKISQNREDNNGCADDDTCYGFCPRFAIAGKHSSSPFLLLDSGATPVWLDAFCGGAGYQYGSVGCTEAVVYIYYGNVGGT
jgi:NAD-dependent dihydropyrimidine dehydrogenase PreA subunit